MREADARRRNRAVRELHSLQNLERMERTVELKEGWLERQLRKASETVSKWSKTKREALRVNR